MPIAWKRLEEEPSVAPPETAPAPEMERLETFVPETPIRSLEDLIVSEVVRNRLEAALNRIRYHEKLYDTWNLKKIDPQGRRVAINFFGHPGTGKTFCAEAIAHHLGKPIITVNYAEIESKYVGETPKNITAAFEQARVTDSVLFFDEADSILGKRLTNVTQSADHGVNVSRSVMLLQLDKFEGVVIFASNLPENYDGAFVRRILAHIEFELPNLDCRLRLWQYLLPSEVPRAEDVTAEWLAAQSEGLAGGDILNVVKLAASQAVARSGIQCQVLQADLLGAIDQVRDSKTKVGSREKVQPVVKETLIQPEDLAPDLRQQYNLATAQIAVPVPSSS
jgi:SpoVK/Ycf46/Vps4 family AAA+-type ATPase